MAATDSRGENVRVAVLGTGIMGSAMARNLVSAGLRTTVWDRSPTATEPLSDAGALVAATTIAAAQEQSTTLQLVQQNNSGISGTATFTPSGGGLKVDLKVTGAGAGLCLGRCCQACRGRERGRWRS